MSEPPRRIELPPEAELARKFIEALVERYEKRIRELGQRVQVLGPRLVSRGKPDVADVLDGIHELQWGRDLLVAERAYWRRFPSVQ